MIFPRLLLVTLALTAPLAAATRAKPTRPDSSDLGSYKGAIVMDAATGNILFENNPDVVTPPASMTKLMTFAVLHDKLADKSISLDTMVTVSRDEAKFAMRSDSTSVWLKEKETFPVEELIYAMMIQSANDAALTLARAAGGSPEAFIELMNAKARELGMKNSIFRTPHGLTRGKISQEVSDVTSPRDFAILCRHLLLHTDVLKYTSIKTRSFGASQRTQLVEMSNHNKLLGKVNGVDGLKTGYTTGAGYCLSATAQRNGRRLIVVIMGSFGPKGAIDKGRTRDLKTIELIEQGFTALPPGSPAFASSVTPGTAADTTTLAPAPLTTAEKKAGAPADPVIKFSLPGAKK